MITLFCLRRAGDSPPARGLSAGEGRPVRMVEVGPVGAWICAGELIRNLDGIRAHDAVVRSALRSATPLPVRFGTQFTDDADLAATLIERREEFLSSLSRIEGKVEMAVRLEWSGKSPVEPAVEAHPEVVRSGRQYLEARKRELAAAEGARAHASARLEAVEAWVASEALEGVHRLLPEPGAVGVMAHLVHRHGVGGYRARVEEARSAFPDLALHVTGPWAPYSFV